jgi:nickel transport protein
MIRWLILGSGLLFFSAAGFAHDVHLKPTIVGDRVRVEAFFEDDSPAAQAKVVVRLGDVIVAEGETDAEGVWSFPAPPVGTYAITLDARDGHVKTVPLLLTSTAPPDQSRAVMTSTPWLKLSLGVAGLLLLSTVSWWRLRRRG